MNNQSSIMITTDVLKKDKEETKFRKALYTFYKNKIAFVSFILLLCIVLSVLFANLIAPYNPYEGSIVDRLRPIGSPGHILGTDEQGRDMLSRILFGGRLTLLAGCIPVIVAAVFGGCLGVVAGYFGGKVNTLIMRMLDIFYAFPTVILSIGISASLGQGMTNIIIAISIVFIPPVARVTETAVKRVRSLEFIEAAKSSGANSISIMWHHIIPNIFSQIFVFSSTQIALSIEIAAGLSFLGLGVSPPTPEWGIILNNIKQLIFVDPILTIIPGTFIFFSALTVNLVSDGIRDALQVKN
jgi:peptide/nickel transport system permease protein